MDAYLVILTIDNDVDHAVYVQANDCESAFVEAAKRYRGSHVQPRVAQLIAEASRLTPCWRLRTLVCGNASLAFEGKPHLPSLNANTENTALARKLEVESGLLFL